MKIVTSSTTPKIQDFLPGRSAPRLPTGASQGRSVAAARGQRATGGSSSSTPVECSIPNERDVRHGRILMIRRIKGLLRSRMFKDRWKLFDSESSQWISRTGMALVASVLVLSVCGVLFHSAVVQGSPDSPRNPRILLSVVQPTTTPKTPVPLQLEDIFISVKTTKKNYASRLDVIIKTWFQLAKDHVWFFTDDLDPEYTDKTSK